MQAWNVFFPTVSISIFCEMAFNISVISHFVIISWMEIRYEIYGLKTVEMVLDGVRSICKVLAADMVQMSA